ncbi:hypothetical protein A3B18_03995 [Candidatus Giovannonibacteria bacterium RIFCSPLOWO2_01_FULL_46_13]|uniref:Uncharacterized protein n=1 Tax=Candidatus Giovannonibacteria bacterium RIFCSPLOWO2_01_FULL_46_13 TaxID=1798352 RepID=A0A1F5X4X0_9BACT|nr:MAG: hypothetical protein A3E35_00910 [Candidatus Giovannonibacteria bacterium RIFCSPHIGHO2_12_FULL_44_22]OGF82934.1 MAG: hypothetical protein A3B18_03995 [Candidatus Giovannonibacteria bacterium RIFCSPLOWO2_01_FULL_46_13]
MLDIVQTRLSIFFLILIGLVIFIWLSKYIDVVLPILLFVYAALFGWGIGMSIMRRKWSFLLWSFLVIVSTFVVLILSQPGPFIAF